MSEQVELSLVWAGVMGYAISLLALLNKGFLKKNQWLTAVLLVLSVGFFAMAIAVRWIRLDQGPFFTLYEILLSNLFSLGLIYTFVFYQIPSTRIGAPVVISILLMLGVWCGIESPDSVPLPASYSNNWLWAHVGLGKLFLGFCLSATGIAVMLLIDRYKIVARSEQAHVSSQATVIWKLMAAGFFFESLMLITGAVWAHDAWGRYWSWDPLETWAFLTWLCLAILLHARLTFKSMSQPLGWIGVVAIFVLAFLTFFGIPFLSLAPHKGIL